MSNIPLISIIIPVYNVEKYISRSLTSCINQTLTNIEILIIDDCGNDNSLNIAQSFAKKDKRIKIINNPQNLGTFNARLKGIKEASGYYLLFLDADDYLTTNACEVAINAIKENSKETTDSALAESSEKSPDSASQIQFAESATFCHSTISCYSERSEESKKNPFAILSESEISQKKQNRVSSVVSFPQNDKIKKSQNDNDFAESALDSAPDIVFFGMDFYPRTFRRISPPIITKTLYNEEILEAVFAHCATPPWHIWAKLYKASRIKCVGEMLVAHMGEDKRLTMAEDALKSFWICALSKKSIGIKQKLYFYCDNDASITRKIDKATRDRRISDISRVIDELENLKNVPALTQNPAFEIAQRRTINILKSVVALEYRYDGVFAGEGGGKCDFSLFEILHKITQISSQVADLREDGVCDIYLWESETLAFGANSACGDFSRFCLPHFLDRPLVLSVSLTSQKRKNSSIILKFASNKEIAESKKFFAESAPDSALRTNFAESTPFCHSERSEESHKNRDSSLRLRSAQNDNFKNSAESSIFLKEVA